MKNNFITNKKERLSYGLWFVGQNIIYILVLQYLSLYLTDEIGIAEAAVGVLFLVARVWDAVNDPLLGALVDKVEPKKGKFKPWINAVSIIMPIVTIFLFWSFKGTNGMNLTYAYISYIIWGMTYTISDVPIFALSLTMSDNVEERVSIMSIGRLAAGVSGIVVGILAAPMIAAAGFTSTVVILMVVAFLVMLPLRFFVKERVQYKREQSVTFKSMFRAIARNKYLLIFYASFILIGSTNTAFTIGAYFAKWNLGDLAINGVIMATMVPSMILIPALTPKLVKTFGKRKLFITGMVVAIVFSVIQYFVGYDNLVLFLIINFFKMLGLMIPMMMLGIFTADCVEYGAYKNKTRNEGVTFSIQTFSTKLSSAFAGSISLFLLAAYGYDGSIDQAAGGVQSAEALQGIWITTTLLPIVGLVLGTLVFVLFYKLSEKDVQGMMFEMNSDKKIVEEL